MHGDMTHPSPQVRVSDERWSQIHRRVLHADDVGFHEGAPSTPDRRRVPDNDVLDLLADHESLCAELSRLRERIDSARVAMSQALDALESDSDLEQRRAAFERIQEEFKGVRERRGEMSGE